MIAHALLESGNGTSNFASGRYGMYNYFGIGAYDNNPNNAIAFAKIADGQHRQKQLSVVLNLLDRITSTKGKTHYTVCVGTLKPCYTSICNRHSLVRTSSKHNIQLLQKIGLKGLYYIRDKYK